MKVIKLNINQYRKLIEKSRIQNQSPVVSHPIYPTLSLAVRELRGAVASFPNRKALKEPFLSTFHLNNSEFNKFKISASKHKKCDYWTTYFSFTAKDDDFFNQSVAIASASKKRIVKFLSDNEFSSEIKSILATYERMRKKLHTYEKNHRVL